MPHMNVNIPDELHKECKLAAVINDIPLKNYILGAIEEALRDKH